MATMSLTFADVLIVDAGLAPGVDEGPVAGEVRHRALWQRDVVQVEQLAVVGGARRRAAVQERAAQNLVLYLAGASTSLHVVGLGQTTTRFIDQTLGTG